MFQLLQSHTSVRHYTNEEIPQETIHDIVLSGQHASSSNFVQAYSIIHVTDEDKKRKLADLSNNHTQIESAPVTFVFCADLYRVKRAAEKHTSAFYGKTAENFLVAIIDTALFAQNTAVAAESKGYGICYIGGIRNNIKAVSDLFNLPEFVMPLFAMTIGVPAKRNEVKPRLPQEAIIHENSYYTEKYDDLLTMYDDIMRLYYKNRSENKKASCWTRDMANFLGEVRREHMPSFINDKGFFLS